MSRRPTTRAVQRGYVLIEVAIVFTVAVLLSGLLFSIYNEMLQNQRVQTAERHIENAKSAIINYALASEIPDIEYLYRDSRVVWRVPSGRIHIPCPDITGDGIEDRVLPPSRSAPLRIVSWSATREVRGSCWRQKGWLPWKTLNLTPYDPWGNYYTYYVDSNLSNAVFGFNQETQIDHGSYYENLRLQEVVQPLSGNTVTVAIRRTFVRNRSETVGRALATRAVLDVWNGVNIESHFSPAIVCVQAPCGAQAPGLTNDDLVAGTINDGTDDFISSSTGYNTEQPVYVISPPGYVTEGLPFVVVSHGANGYGALRGDSHAGNLSCHDTSAATPDELQNAMFLTGVQGCPAVVVVNGKEGGFVARPRQKSGDGQFDDIVGWMTMHELVTELNQLGVFPANGLPLLGLERIG